MLTPAKLNSSMNCLKRRVVRYSVSSCGRWISWRQPLWRQPRPDECCRQRVTCRARFEEPGLAADAIAWDTLQQLRDGRMRLGHAAKHSQRAGQRSRSDD